MPSTIPYDPALTLGNVVPQDKLANILQMAQLQAPADAAQANLNAMITLKRSIDMTIQEMMNMQITPDDLLAESVDIGKQIQKAYLQLVREASLQSLRVA